MTAMVLFLNRMRLEYKNMGFAFWFPLFLVWVVIPIVAWFNFMSRWIGSDALYYTAEAVEMMFPLFSAAWTLLAVDKYIRSGTRNIIAVYRRGKAGILEILFNCCCLMLAAAVFYWYLSLYVSNTDILWGEWIRTSSQILFFNALVYAAAFLLKDSVYGFIAAAGYFVVFYMLNLDFESLNIFSYAKIFHENAVVMARVRKTCIMAGILLLIGLMAEKLRSGKKKTA